MEAAELTDEALTRYIEGRFLEGDIVKVLSIQEPARNNSQLALVSAFDEEVHETDGVVGHPVLCTNERV